MHRSAANRRDFLRLLGLTPALGAAFAQDTPTFKTEVGVVSVYATVRDQNGKIVNSLSKDDFTLEEDGKTQEIRYFARQSDLPLTMGLLVDTSMSQRRLIEAERAAATQFFRQVLRPTSDQAFIIQFDSEITLLKDLTAVREELEDALKELKAAAPPERGGPPRFAEVSFAPQGWPPGVSWPGGGTGGRRGPSGGSGRGPGGGGPPRMRGRGGTTLYDAVFLSADEILAKPPGRKAVIIVSDGVDTGSKVTLEKAVESSLRADTLIYTIRYYDSKAYLGPQGGGGGWPGGGGQGGRGGGPGPGGGITPPDGKKTLESLSTQTGGRAFESKDEKRSPESSTRFRKSCATSTASATVRSPTRADTGASRSRPATRNCGS